MFSSNTMRMQLAVFLLPQFAQNICSFHIVYFSVLMLRTLVSATLQIEMLGGQASRAKVLIPYDKVSDQPFILVREMDESESGQMVLEKVKWPYFDAYL